MNETVRTEPKKRGRRPKNEERHYVINVDQSKFFIDLSSDSVGHSSVIEILRKCNDKQYGKEITIKDIFLYCLPKINQKDIEKLQESSLSEMEKVNRALDEFNQKNNLNLTLGEFLVKKLSIC